MRQWTSICLMLFFWYFAFTAEFPDGTRRTRALHYDTEATCNQVRVIAQGRLKSDLRNEEITSWGITGYCIEAEILKLSNPLPEFKNPVGALRI